MKRIITLLLLISCIGLYAQLDQIPGTYFFELGESRHIIEYTLTLQENGTFLFHSYKKIVQGPPQEEHLYGKGKWTIEMVQNFSTTGFVVSFSADRVKDFDKKHTLDFNSSKARFISKSQRDISDKVVIPRLQFFESDIGWMERMAINKQPNKMKTVDPE